MPLNASLRVCWQKCNLFSILIEFHQYQPLSGLEWPNHAYECEKILGYTSDGLHIDFRRKWTSLFDHEKTYIESLKSMKADFDWKNI